MQTKLFSVLVLTLIIPLSACSPFRIDSSSGEQPTPVEGSDFPTPGNQTPTTFPPDLFQITYLGPDGNVWYRPGPEGQPEQITTDATSIPISSNGYPSISYYFPQISSDGEWIAYRRDSVTLAASGKQFSYGLWIQNRKSGESQVVLEELATSFAWKPGTHLLAYGLEAPENYFSFTGVSPDASPLHGVMGFDAGTGRTVELVKPERGYALHNIQWSPDGQYLGFDELVYIEGRGLFGYYDFESGTYVAWDETIGNYAWHPRGSQIIYDRLTYVAMGAEDIFVRSIDAEAETRLTDYTSETEYAFYPSVSPLGDRVAYLTSLEGPDSQKYRLQVQDLAGGEFVSIGNFVSANRLAWSPDGKWLLFSAGPWEDQELYSVDVANGIITILGPGSMLDVAGG